MELSQKFRNVISWHSEAITAANQLPNAYNQYLEDTGKVEWLEDGIDWSGMKDQNRHAKTEVISDEEGSFNFFFWVDEANNRQLYTQNVARMIVTESVDGFLFSAESGSVLAPKTFDEKNYQPVIELAIKNGVKISESNNLPR